MNVKEMIEILEPLPGDMPVEIGLQSLSESTGSRGIRQIQFVGIEQTASPHRDRGVDYKRTLCFYIEENNRIMSDTGFIPTYEYRCWVKRMKENTTPLNQ